VEKWFTFERGGGVEGRLREVRSRRFRGCRSPECAASQT
jgi:hypothetical protein